MAPGICRRATAPPILRAYVGDRALDHGRWAHARAALPAEGPLPVAPRWCRVAAQIWSRLREFLVCAPTDASGTGAVDNLSAKAPWPFPSSR